MFPKDIPTLARVPASLKTVHTQISAKPTLGVWGRAPKNQTNLLHAAFVAFLPQLASDFSSDVHTCMEYWRVRRRDKKIIKFWVRCETD
jgi:hypothetical protein